MLDIAFWLRGLVPITEFRHCANWNHFNCYLHSDQPHRSRPFCFFFQPNKIEQPASKPRLESEDCSPWVSLCVRQQMCRCHIECNWAALRVGNLLLMRHTTALHHDECGTTHMKYRHVRYTYTRSAYSNVLHYFELYIPTTIAKHEYVQWCRKIVQCSTTTMVTALPVYSFIYVVFSERMVVFDVILSNWRQQHGQRSWVHCHV